VDLRPERASIVAEARREKLAMQLPMMDFILRGEVVVIVEGRFGYSKKGTAPTFLYSYMSWRVSSCRLDKTVEHDRQGPGSRVDSTLVNNGYCPRPLRDVDFHG
jgi:hypothetical protein